jgi:hypothetical protein
METKQSGSICRVRAGGLVALVIAGALGAFGCSQPTSPTTQATHQTDAVNVTSAVAHTDGSSSPAHISPADLTAHGWSCEVTPIGNRIICSQPNQGFPAFGAPADRPANFTFLTFSLTGDFIGTEILIRTDLYNGQRCESTDLPYVFRARIGYYECVHTVGG